MYAYESLNVNNRIERAAVISSRFGDDTATLYAIPESDVPLMRSMLADLGATFALVPPADALAAYARGEWIGIHLVTVTGKVAAWGRAVLGE